MKNKAKTPLKLMAAMAFAASLAGCATRPELGAAGPVGPSATGSADLYGYRPTPDTRPAPTPQTLYANPAAGQPSPWTGRVVDRAGPLHYCTEFNGRAMYVDGYAEKVIGADGQIWAVMRNTTAYPNQFTWSCSTIGSLNPLLQRWGAKLAPNGGYNNVGHSGSYGYGY